MGRPPLPIGALGEIKATQLASGRWAARAWCRDIDGERRRIRGSGATEAAAKRDVKARHADRTPPTLSSSEITADTKLVDLARIWLVQITEEERRRPQTIDRYRYEIKHNVTPALGGYRLRELTAGRVQGVLDTKTASGAKEMAKPLRMMLDVAVRHDAIRINPARQAVPKASPDVDPVTIGIGQLIDLRHRAQLWVSGEIDDEGKPRRKRTGRPRRTDLLDVIDLFLATGVRTSELMATRWDEDVDLTADPVTITVSGTLVYLTGVGLDRQDLPKTPAGYRVLALPEFGAEILRRRYKTRTCNKVIATATGQWMHPSTLRTTWRRARKAAGYDWVEFRTMRRTVATVIAEELDAAAAAGQLGHDDDGRTARRHYIARSATKATDLSELLQRKLAEGA